MENFSKTKISQTMPAENTHRNNQVLKGIMQVVFVVTLLVLVFAATFKN